MHLKGRKIKREWNSFHWLYQNLNKSFSLSSPMYGTLPKKILCLQPTIMKPQKSCHPCQLPSSQIVLAPCILGIIIGHGISTSARVSWLFWTVHLNQLQELNASRGICSKQGGRLATPAHRWDELRGIINFHPRNWVHDVKFVWKNRHGESFVINKNLNQIAKRGEKIVISWRRWVWSEFWT